MAKFEIRKGYDVVRTDCPEIALNFGGRLMKDEVERQKLQMFLQVHLDVQQGIRELLKQGLGDGVWITSDTPKALDVREQLAVIHARATDCLIGICKVSYDPKRGG